MPAPVLSRAFYARDAATVARALLGQRLVRILPTGERLAGLITETEAYLGPEDLASHAARGRRTPRNASMWARPGTVYIYRSHGIHHCVNLSTLRAEHPAAVLLRAIEPTEGLARIRAHRPAARRDTDLCAGPGRLAQALALTLDHNALDAAEPTPTDALFVERARPRPIHPSHITTTPRIGIGAAAAEWRHAPLRFRIAGHPHASRDPAQTPGSPERPPKPPAPANRCTRP